MSRVVLCGTVLGLIAAGIFMVQRDVAVPEARVEVVTVTRSLPQIEQPAEVVELSFESAILTAAFGMEALQPETYDRDMVVELIEASPLSRTAKTKLSVDLAAAEAGRGDLHQVLSDVRVALAVERH